MKLILFDVDGTLTATGASDMDCFAAAYEHVFGRPIPSRDWGYYEHITDSGVAGEIFETHHGRAIKAAEMDQFEEAFVEELRRHAAENPAGFTEVPGARTLIEHLLETGRNPFALATGCFRDSALFKLETIGVDARGFPRGCANDSTSRVEIVKTAIARSAGRPEDAVYIGDGLWDVKVCKELGIPLVAITHEQPRRKMEDAGARTFLQDYRDPEAFFQALEEAAVPGTA